jgi:hypothetical protein
LFVRGKVKLWKIAEMNANKKDCSE